MDSKTSILDREVYSEAGAARLLGVAQSTLHYWLEGGKRREKIYQPVIRSESTGSRKVTWGEFVEAGLLSAYRKRNIPMTQLRMFISTLREEFGIPYPLAHHRPWVSEGAGLVMHAQEESGLDPQWWLWANGQRMLTQVATSFVDRVEFDGDIARAYRPHADPASPVRVDPLVRFGRPAIKGISTDAIFEQSEAGASVDELAKTYGLTEREVRWALAYEGTKTA